MTGRALVAVLLLSASGPGTAIIAAETAGNQEQEIGGLAMLSSKDTPLKKGERIVFFGDSITQFGGNPDGYLWLIQQALKQHRPELEVAVINAGISGNKVPDLLARLDRDVIAKQPTVVFVYIGINDVWHSLSGAGTPKDQFDSGLRELLQKIKASGATVVLATPSVIGEKPDGSNSLDKMLDEYAGISRALAKELTIELCDLRQSFIDHLKAHNKDNAEKGILTADSVHLNAAGNRLVAERAAEAIASALRVDTAPNFRKLNQLRRQPAPDHGDRDARAQAIHREAPVVEVGQAVAGYL